MSQESVGFTPDMKILGSVQLTEPQAELINKYAATIMNGSVSEAERTFKIIFDRPPIDDTEMTVFAGLCQHVMEGNLLEGRPMTWDDIPPEKRP